MSSQPILSICAKFDLYDKAAGAVPEAKAKWTCIYQARTSLKNLREEISNKPENPQGAKSSLQPAQVTGISLESNCCDISLAKGRHEVMAKCTLGIDVSMAEQKLLEMLKEDLQKPVMIASELPVHFKGVLISKLPPSLIITVLQGSLPISSLHGFCLSCEPSFLRRAHDAFGFFFS